MGSEADRRNDFFELVRHWTVRDHFNPGIKAEVIWDMLLSEYVPEIVSYCVEPGKEGCEGYRILAKEFPLRSGKKENSLANAKADYLVEGPKCLYLVELKTTDSSFDDAQFARYCRYAEGADMWDFYLQVIAKNVKTTYLEETKREDRSKANYLTHVKYMEQLQHVFGSDMGGIKNREAFDRELRSRAEEKKKKSVKLIYLTLFSVNAENMLNAESLALYERNRDRVSFAALDELGDDFAAKKRVNGSTWEKIKELIESVRKEDIDKGIRTDMSYFLFHRGSDQIGGCCTEFCCGKERILIDFGANLPGSDEESPITDRQLVQSVFSDGKEYGAVLFTHYHGDHYGLYRDIPQGTDLYIGKTAKEILRIVTEYIDRNAPVKGSERIDAMKCYEPGRELKLKGIGNMKIVPLAVDHSALDAYMFYMEMAGKRILYTGDFRDHGIYAENGRFRNLLESDKFIPAKIDILITEGTMLSRTQEAAQNSVRTEAELGAAAAGIFRKTKYNFVLVSSTNLDSIMEFYQNTPDDMPFVCDLYQLRLMSKAMQGRKGIRMYQPKKTADGQVKPVCLLMERGDDRIGELIEDNKKNGLFLPLQPVGPANGYADLKNGFVMLVRPNHFPENGRSQFEKALDHFSEPDEKEVTIVYSMWKGYLSGEKEDKSITAFIGRHAIHPLHVSGHAYPETIREVIEMTDPEVIVPMHTEMADEMKNMKIFEDCKDRIVRVRDCCECFDLERMEVKNI
ncbi:MAG: MBL fold metallo-hydrolase [Lachnospiraceae bacterium]|nr:MBL fold metallo-hydrolase [Lachnospiraceae bacterium]